MSSIFANDRVRSGFLNFGIVLVFVCAWVADKWPEVTYGAVAAATIVVVVEASVLGLMAWSAHRSKNNDPLTDGAALISGNIHTSSEKQPPENHASSDRSVLSHMENVALREAVNAWAEADTTRFEEITASAIDGLYKTALAKYDVQQHVRASIASTWALDSLPATQLRMLVLYSRNLVHHRPKNISKPIGGWEVLHLPGNAFNVKAGSFTIEHTEGHTVILVHDPTRVTVEEDHAPAWQGGWEQLHRQTDR